MNDRGSDSDEREAAVHDVEESRRELGRALVDLEDVVRSGLDPARWIAERPLPWLLGGLALGLWLGTKR
jgi:hypothetical protein